MLSTKFKLLAALLSVSFATASTELETRATDPCASIAGKKWAAPKDVRACYKSIKVDPTLKANILEVVNKTIAFHTSVNYQILAPAPYTLDVHENLYTDIARISSTAYASDYDFHVDLSRTFKRLNDGHCVWVNRCYDSAFINYLPIPLVLLTESDGSQNVHIAPEAFKVASAEFPDQIDVWQNATNGQLASLSGAKVLLINNLPPFIAVNANALITGSYQAFGTRQNSFFSSYQTAATGWTYIMGNFAQQALPLDDQVKLLIQKVNSTKTETVTLPYRSRIGTAIKSFTDVNSYLANNCKAVTGTNGVDYNDTPPSDTTDRPAAKYQQSTPVSVQVEKKHPLNVILDTTPLSNVVLPPELQPALTTVEGSRTVSQFYLLNDGKTGVLSLGSFSDASFEIFLNSLLTGLVSLKAKGATQLIVDVTNNGGGFICAAHWLHRIIIGPKSTTVPNAGLDTEARAGPLAQLIAKQIVTNPSLDANGLLLYNPINWRNANNQFFNSTDDWLQPPVSKVINGRRDAFSQRLGQECQPESFPSNIPETGLFDPKKVVIVNNGRCASSCSLFSITMAKHEGVRTVVVGGQKGVPQQYCGTVGGQSTDFSTMDSEVKTTHLKNNTLAPPDLLVNGVQGITWRLGFGIDKPEEPEEWQNHPADLNLPLTAATVNNPVAIWEDVARRLLA